MDTKILLLGESDVGKTHFGGQLLGRLNQEQGYLRMVGSVGSLAGFEEVLDALNDGRAAQHTSALQYIESTWTVADPDGNAINLVWPDYGGEQVKAIRQDRKMPQAWRERVVASNAWVVMVRVHNTEVSDDIFSRPIADLNLSPNQPRGTFAMSEQARLVDFLQWLLFVKGRGMLRRIETPQLMLVLSCWDELPTEEAGALPSRVLESRMPLVGAFLRSNWEPSSVRVVGLSALERPLKENSRDEEFIDKGPEQFGYVVDEGGQRSKDLTLMFKPFLQVA
ncbi:TRAFAC clade GTPase domain-containing protein [Agrobacterium tumefaciens]|uniref:TRAFAC clade GTPase domain-containing protein n=1 Tax=Agrobacterium tumefaciens TaxID=358 RepID=UPI002786E2DC|nr:hypothetical protein [Agrobacterium tumefaciens]MDP9788999.1 hypothetical protein [Agrobacterium tumefaciens]